MWRVYFTDGTIAESLEQIDTAKTYQAAAELFEGRRFCHVGGDYLCYRSGRWYCDSAPTGEICLTGELIPTPEFKKFRKRAVEWLRSL